MGIDGTELGFAAELARLKRRGSAVLVRGRGDHLGICTDLQGSDDEPRLRVLVRSADTSVLPVPPQGAAIVEASTGGARSSSRNEAAAFDPSAVVRRVEAAGDVDALTSAVAEEVDRAAAAGVEPGELRVCLGRLDPHLARAPEGRVADAVGTVADAVRGHSGICHAHVAFEAPGVVERNFDVTVETRTTFDRVHQHRWLLNAAGIDTGWFPFGSR